MEEVAKEVEEEEGSGRKKRRGKRQKRTHNPTKSHSVSRWTAANSGAAGRQNHRAGTLPSVGLLIFFFFNLGKFAQRSDAAAVTAGEQKILSRPLW